MSNESDTRSSLEEALRAPVRAVLDRPSRALTTAVADRVAEILIEEGVVERAVDRALKDPSTERAAVAVLDSELLDEIVQRLLVSNEFQQIVERIANAPEVRNAITRQGVGLIDDLRRQLMRVAKRLDDVIEMPFRAIARRGARDGPVPFAGGVTRVLALALDAVIINGVLLGIAALVSLVFGAFTDDSAGTGAIAAGAASWVVATGFYLFSFWALTGQTPGMRFLGVEVRASDGGKLYARRAFWRVVGIGVSVLTLGLGFALMLFNDRRRGLQDRFGRSVVLYRDPEHPELSPAGAESL